MRLLIIIGLIYVAYRVLKAKLGGGLPQPGNAGAIDSEMIQDPVCGTYFSRKDGVRLSWKGEDLWFCSTACRDRYLADHNSDRS